MQLLDLIKEQYKIISIIGMSKNAGKTTTLNEIISEAYEEDIPIGISSIGRDGESLDIVTETEKPKIWVSENTYVATAQSLLLLSDANVEIMMTTNYRTPLGEVVIGKVRSAGYIQLAGPQTLKEMKKVSEDMLNLGAKFVIIDGSLDRKSQAAPAISDATILATGAAISRDLNRVVEETLHTISLLRLKKVENKYENILKSLLEESTIAIVDEDFKIERLKYKTALGMGREISEHIKENSRYLLIPGSLVKSTISELLSSTHHYKNLTIAVSDGTKIFIPPKDYLHFLRMGLKIEVVYPINLIGVTVNPYSPYGYYFEPEELLKKMKSYIKDIPVIDIMIGG